ncbi:MAG: DUF2089 domain-containing protein [Gammaproteobacteria bacterium]|nr:DUF2089 domain-containing protein [Gammaproteobacteria bacterium]
MSKKILNRCPICDGEVVISEFKCTECGTKVVGEFPLSKFDYLSEDLQNFALIFIKNQGNIKSIEKDLNISYPTVKKTLEELINALGFTATIEEGKKREDVLNLLKNGDITFEEAEEALKEAK